MAEISAVTIPVNVDFTYTATAPTRAPWTCPRCNRVNAPHVDQCACPSSAAPSPFQSPLWPDWYRPLPVWDYTISCGPGGTTDVRFMGLHTPCDNGDSSSK